MNDGNSAYMHWSKFLITVDICYYLKMFKRILTYLIIVLIVALLSFYALLTPLYVTDLQFQHEHIKIIRNRHAIPHIYAPSRRGFLYAWGYVLAQDRLFQSTFRRYYVEGRLSQLLGPRALQADIMMKDLSFNEIATQMAQKIKIENQTYSLDLQAYCQGINDQVSRRLSLPLEFYLLGIKWEPWTVVATLELFKLLDWGLSHNAVEQYARSSLLVNHTVQQLNRLIPNNKQSWSFSSQNVIKDEYIPNHLKSSNLIVNDLFEPLKIQNILQLGMPQFTISAQGSNAWAVRGEHTQSGKAILSGDPHLDSAMPSNLYQFKTTYIHNNKTIRYAGVGPPGLIISYGKTDYFAAAMTVTQTDTQDLYLQKINGNKYYTDGEWRNLRVRSEKIFIKQGSKLRQYNHTVKFTHRGPIMHYFVSAFGAYQFKETISLAWVGFNTQYKSMMNIGTYNMQIDNFEDLERALIYDSSHFLSFSILFATSDNHIIYQQSGVNPIRRNYTAGSYIKDGTSSKDDWIGFIPANQRMHVSDPKNGFLVAANNRVTSNQFRGGYFNHMVYTARADRLTQLLQREIASGRKITNQFATSLLYDTIDVYCRQIIPQIVSIQPKAKHILNQFDCNFIPDSYQATIYQAFMLELWHLVKPLPTRNVSLFSLHVFHQCVYKAIHEGFGGDTQKRVAIHRAWDSAIKRLSQFFKTSEIQKWRWGIFHRDISIQIPLGHNPLFSFFYNRQTQGWGNFHTANVGKCNKLEFGNFGTSHRAVYRSIFDFGGTSWWIVDGGASQNMLTDHYDDQWKLFISQKLIPVWEEEVSQTKEL